MRSRKLNVNTNWSGIMIGEHYLTFKVKDVNRGFFGDKTYRYYYSDKRILEQYGSYTRSPTDKEYDEVIESEGFKYAMREYKLRRYNETKG